MIFSRRGGRRLRLQGTVRIWSPGRTHELLEEPMRTWTVDGRTVTDRAGAAEHLGLSRATIDMYASPTGQRRYGFPAPLPQRCDGQQVLDVADLDAFAAARRPARQPAPPSDPATAEQLVDSTEFAALIGVGAGTFHRYLNDSWTSWAQDRAVYLPRPDNWDATLIDQVTGRLPQIATRWATDTGEVVNEAAVAAQLGCDVETVLPYREAAARPHEFPAPAPDQVDGQVVYEAAAVDALTTAGPRHEQERVPALIYCPQPGTGRRMVNQAGIAVLMDLPPATVARAAKSGTSGFPEPVDGPGEHGPWYDLDAVVVFAGQWAMSHPMWRRSTVDAWSHGDRNRTGGRKAGRRPTATDLRAVLAEADAAGEQLTTAEMAQRLSERLDTDVSAQVVTRLKRRLVTDSGEPGTAIAGTDDLA